MPEEQEVPITEDRVQVLVEKTSPRHDGALWFMGKGVIAQTKYYKLIVEGTLTINIRSIPDNLENDEAIQKLHHFEMGDSEVLNNTRLYSHPTFSVVDTNDNVHYREIWSYEEAMSKLASKMGCSPRQRANELTEQPPVVEVAEAPWVDEEPEEREREYRATLTFSVSAGGNPERVFDGIVSNAIRRQPLSEVFYIEETD